MPKKTELAFPVVHPNPTDHDAATYGDAAYVLSAGMELRDWFAAQCLNGMLSSAPVVDRMTVDKILWTRQAYEWADVMMKARVPMVLKINQK